MTRDPSYPTNDTRTVVVRLWDLGPGTLHAVAGDPAAPSPGSLLISGFLSRDQRASSADACMLGTSSMDQKNHKQKSQAPDAGTRDPRSLPAPTPENVSASSVNVVLSAI